MITAYQAITARPVEARSNPGARPSTHRGSIDYVPALDGLRALAVGSVIAFHFGIAGTTGGFLGVDVFFVLSGFLITSLVTADWSSTGTVSLTSFWGRRARRLFPALFVTLVGVSVAAAFLDSPDQLPGIRGDALSTLLYVANWHYIVSSQNYFAHFGLPSPLLHTWSLAVEEQFYLFWPLAVLGIVAWTRRLATRRLHSPGAPGADVTERRWATTARRRLAWLSLAGALTSAVWMASRFHPGRDPSRLYFGTDTHAQVILVGALLACLAPGAAWAATRARRAALWTIGVTGALFVAWEVHAMLGRAPLHPAPGFAGHATWFFDGVLGSQDFLYRGGFLAISVGVAAVIALVVSLPGSSAARILAVCPIRYLGRISYGLYLYHWPTFTFLNPSSTGLSGLALLVARLGVTFSAAVVSFHWLETPIRQGLGGRLSVRRQIGGLLPAGAACVVASVLVSTSLPAGAAPQVSPRVSLPPGAHPVKVLMVGDSVALTLGIGLSLHESSYNVSIDNQGELGCSIAQTNPIENSGTVGKLPPCNPLSGQTWQQFWPQLLSQVHPDVVLALFGRWEAVNRMYDGSWMHAGMPAYDKYLTAQLTDAVGILSSSGAAVALMTAPYYAEPPAPDGTPYPENDPERANAWNAVVRKVAASVDARHPGTVTVIDLGGMLDPGGRYTNFVDGVPVRCADGVHMSYQAGELITPLVLPTLERLGAAAYARGGARQSLSPVGAFSLPTVSTTPAALRKQVSASLGVSSPYCPYGGGG